MRAALVLVLAALAVLFARPAQAHSDIAGSSPKADSTITTAPSEITVTFADAIRGKFSTVVVTGPDGVRYGVGTPRAVDRTLHQPVKPLAPGKYTVAWRVVSGDGHPLQGVFAFTADLPAAPSASPSSAAPSPAAVSTQEDDDEGSNGLFVAAAAAGVLVVIAGGAGGAVLARRRRTS